MIFFMDLIGPRVLLPLTQQPPDGVNVGFWQWDGVNVESQILGHFSFAAIATYFVAKSLGPACPDQVAQTLQQARQTLTITMFEQLVSA